MTVRRFSYSDEYLTQCETFYQKSLHLNNPERYPLDVN